MRRIFSLLIASSLLLAACGGSDSGPDPTDDPKAALTSALQNLGSYEGVTAGLSLRSDEASLIAISEGELTDELAEVILGSSISVTARGGESFEDLQFELVADIGGDKVELRLTEQVVYARADVRDLVERFGGDTAELEGATQGAPPGFEFIGPALDGEWIAIEGATEFLQQFGGIPPGGGGGDEDSAELAAQLADDLTAAIEDNSTVTSVGEDDAGNHLEVKISVKGLVDTLRDIAGSLPGGQALPPDAFPPDSEIPEGDATIDVWVEDDRVSQIELDFLKLADAFSDEEVPSGVESFAIRLTLEEFTGNVEAPDAVETVNFQTLFQGFLGGRMGGDPTTGTDTAPDLSELCAQLEGAPPEVVEQFAEECPDLQS